jgi:hypothetical protein
MGHTLGIYVRSNTVQVMHASILRGAPMWQSGDVLHVFERDLRAATREDFDAHSIMFHPDYLVTAEG